MNYLKTLFLIVTFFLVSMNANANAMHLANNNLSTLRQQPIILTYHTYTEDWYWAMEDEDWWAGDSTTEPCSDLKLVQRFEDLMVVKGSTSLLTSDMLIDKFGPAKTCIRVDFYPYERGAAHNPKGPNIELLWDESSKAYIAATPSLVSVDISLQTN